MDEQIYTNPVVRSLMAKKYLAVMVDQDARPDISNRYEDYGWPATEIFNADHGAIVKTPGLPAACADGIDPASSHRRSIPRAFR